MAANAALEFNTGFFDSKSELVLKGRKAPYRIADKKPVFYSTWSANDVPLVRLKPGSDHDDRNLKISSGSFAPFGGSVKYGVRSEDKVDMEAAERDARGLYKLTPKEPLKPGEYGFVLTYGMAAARPAACAISVGLRERVRRESRLLQELEVVRAPGRRARGAAQRIVGHADRQLSHVLE